MGISSHFSYVNNRKIHYLTCGEGEPLVLLHASVCTAQTFAGVIEYLAKDYKVYAPDLPGYGKSDELAGSFSFDDVAQVIADWALQERIENFVLAGFSMGATIAVHMAKKVDDHIKGYMLIEPYSDKDALMFSKSTMQALYFADGLFNKVIPASLGNKFWNSKKALLFLNKFFDPFNYEHRSTGQQLQILQCASYHTFWHTLDLLLHTRLNTQVSVSFKPSLLIMSVSDKSLDYGKTAASFKQLFPSLQNIPLRPLDHYPKEPITYRYMETHYPTLLKNVEKYFKP